MVFTSVAADCARCVERRRRHLRARPDVHAHDRRRLAARGEERVPVPEWIDGSPRYGGISLNATARTPRAALRRTSAAASSASHSGTMQSGIMRPLRVAAPLVDHPVVVGLDAHEAEVLVVAFRQVLAAEAQPRREAQRRRGVVAVHVDEAGRELPPAGDHLVVGDAASSGVWSRGNFTALCVRTIG